MKEIKIDDPDILKLIKNFSDIRDEAATCLKRLKKLDKLIDAEKVKIVDALEMQFPEMADIGYEVDIEECTLKIKEEGDQEESSPKDKFEDFIRSLFDR